MAVAVGVVNARPLRLAFAVAALLTAGWLALGGNALAQVLLPLQSALIGPLLPGLSAEPLTLPGATQEIVLHARSVEHLVVRGHVVMPGVEVSATTPARQARRVAVIAALAAAWLLATGRPLHTTWPVAALGLAMAVLLPVLVLSGSVWSLFEAPGEVALSNLLIVTSRLLLSGADLALICGVVYLSTTAR